MALPPDPLYRPMEALLVDESPSGKVSSRVVR